MWGTCYYCGETGFNVVVKEKDSKITAYSLCDPCTKNPAESNCVDVEEGVLNTSFYLEPATNLQVEANKIRKLVYEGRLKKLSVNTLARVTGIYRRQVAKIIEDNLIPGLKFVPVSGDNSQRKLIYEVTDIK